MPKVKITAETVRWPGGVAHAGDVVDVPEKAAAYFKAHGYAVDPDVAVATEASPEPIVAKVKRKYTRKKKAD